VQQPDKKFFDRADAHIHLSNDQIDDEITRGKVSWRVSFGAAAMRHLGR